MIRYTLELIFPFGYRKIVFGLLLETLTTILLLSQKISGDNWALVTSAMATGFFAANLVGKFLGKRDVYQE